VDAITYLTSQHRRLESLFSRYERSPGKGRELFGLIERTLIPHAVIEETYVYPLLRARAPGGAVLVDRAVAEHAEVERTLKRMASMHPGSAEFDTAMRQLIDSVSRHVHEEEETPGLLGMLRALLTTREINDLGKTLKIAHDMTPTRAHPMAPDHPPANIIVGLPMAAVDRLRDRVSGRAEAEEALPSPGRMRVRKRRASRKRPTAPRGRGRAATRRSRPKRAAARRRTAAKRPAARRQAQARTTRARRR
jgi:hypothetical protein